MKTGNHLFKLSTLVNIKFVGREREQAVLQATLDSQEAEMVAVIGRRRVGKTFLIKNTYSERIAFEVTGRALCSCFNG